MQNKSQWAFITGASRGIGKEIANFMADKGFNLILHSRHLSHTETLKETLEQKGISVFHYEAELTDAASVQNMLNAIDALEFNVDYVFNNAGLQIAYRSEYYNTPVSDFDISFKVNVIAPAMICYHFLPKMIQRGFGRVINTTSGIALEAEQAGYSASKAALDKFTIDLGSTLEGTNVMMNLVDPGWCRTDLGGPHAPNDVKSTLPGVILPAFLDDQKSGRIFSVQDFNQMTLDEAIQSIQS